MPPIVVWKYALIWSAVLHPPWLVVVLQEYAQTIDEFPLGLLNVAAGRKFTEVIPGDTPVMVVVEGEFAQ